jgi:phospholipase B1
MDAMAAGYTSQIASIHEKYLAQQNDSFAVMFTPADIKVSSFPLEGFR